MAVQAQHPSSILMFNRNDQERKNMADYAMQGQGFLDQSALLFPSGGSASTRKRGREPTAVPPPQMQQQYQYINLFSLQQQQQPSSAFATTTIANLPQLHSQWPQQQQQANTMVSTGLRLSFEEDQIQNQNKAPRPLENDPSSSTTSSIFAGDVAAQIKFHRDEIDRFLLAQGEQLRRILEESRRRHYRALAVAAEESASRRLREREVELEKASRRNAELEERVAKLSAESAAWQAKARADEAAAIALQAQLHQAATDRAAAVEDPAGADAESACMDPRREEEGGGAGRASFLPPCKGCGGAAAATVLVLPCRHLCLCRVCDAAAAACPVCACVKSTSVEVYLS